MQERVLLIGTVILALGVCGALYAANEDGHDVTLEVSAIAEIAVTADVSLTVSAPATPGAIPQNDSDNSAYLQYTSTVPTGQTRSISAAWGGTDAAPAGTRLRLQASPPGGMGTGAAAITVSGSAQNVITAISSCYTGTGGTDGAQLTYTLEVTDATALVANASETVTVTFTMTDAS